MKKLLITVCCIVGAICVSLLSACEWFDDGQSNNQTYGKVGDTLKNSDNVSICVVSCENTQQLGTGFLAETTENNFILLTIKVTNNSNKQQTFYGGCVDLYNSSNVKYEDKTSLNIDYILSEDIGVGITKTFQVVFETPTTTYEEQYIAKIGYSIYTSDRNRVTFILKTESSSNNNTENDAENFSQYYVDECPIRLTTNSYIIYEFLGLYFKNNSDKKIIAYEAVCIFYNVYGNELIPIGHITPYNQISETPINFENGKTDFHEYRGASNVYYAEVYIYYTLFDDQSDWGCRTDISTEKILELGTKYKIERK